LGFIRYEAVFLAAERLSEFREGICPKELLGGAKYTGADYFCIIFHDVRNMSGLSATGESCDCDYDDYCIRECDTV
jgi:hypothetical protein